MAADLSELQWSLTVAGSEFVFGTADTGYPFVKPPDFGQYEIRTQDTDNAGADGDAKGRDYMGGRTVTFQTWAAPGNSVSAFRAAWRGDAIRETPGRLAMLRGRRHGQTRCVFGRPRRFAEDLTIHGHLPDVRDWPQIAHDFSCTDDLFYGDEEKSQVVTGLPTEGGGIIWPITWPVTWEEGVTTEFAATNAGDCATWPTLDFLGPSIRPEAEIAGLWRIVLDVTIPAGVVVTVDPRPGVRTILMGGIGHVALAPTSDQLANVKLPVGTSVIRYSSQGGNGSDSLTVRWRDAYGSLI